MFQSFSIIFLIATLLSFINYKWIKLPATIGTMILALGIAIIITLSKSIAPDFYQLFCDMVIAADFKTLLLDVLLSVLLFAGAIHINIIELKKERWFILLCPDRNTKNCVSEHKNFCINSRTQIPWDTKQPHILCHETQTQKLN